MARINRELDGVYFRVERDGKYENICFSDLTEEEMDSVLVGRDTEWLKRMCVILGKQMRMIGDTLDLVYSDEEE